MKRIFFYLTIFLLIPVLGTADTVLLTYRDNKEQIGFDNVREDSQVQLRTGPVSLAFMSHPIDTIALEKPAPVDTSVIPFIEKIAEASVEPSKVAMESYFKIHQNIQNAGNLDQVRNVVSDNYNKDLDARLAAGANKTMVLQMMQAMRPSSTYIVDSSVEEEKAQIAVKGQSAFGDLYGVVGLAKENGEWKLDQESWMTAEPEDVKKRIAIAKLDTGKIQVRQEPRGNRTQFLSEVNASDYSFDRNPLLLQRVNGYNRKEAFMLTFFVLKEERRRAKSAQEGVHRGQLHILWTGPKELLPTQKRFTTKYPFDVSVANHKDGYLPGHLNLRLPKKRPSEFYASILVNF